MNTKHILIAVLALVPVAMKGMGGITGGNDYSHMSSDPAPANGGSFADRTNRYNALEREYTRNPAEYVNSLGHYTRRDWANARSLAEAQKHRDYRGMLDSKNCTEWNPFTPTPGEPSFLSSFGNQLKTIATFAIAGLIVTTVVKKYLTPKSIRYQEEIELTAKENAVLENLESRIQKFETAIPLCEKDLARKIADYQASYNEEPNFPMNEKELPAGMKIIVTPTKGFELDQMGAQISEEEKLKNNRRFGIASLAYSLEHIKNELAQNRAQRDTIRTAQASRSFA